MEEPLPDYIGYLVAAEENNCPPWEFFEGMTYQPPRIFWAEAGMILSGARADAQDSQRKKAEKKSAQASKGR